jgi:hypothetical protein
VVKSKGAGFFQGLLLSVLILMPVRLAFAQEQPDPALLAEIRKIKAVDNHTHVPRVDLRGEVDDEYDALPCSGYVEPTADNVMVRPDNPEYRAAWKALWGYAYNDAAPAHVKELVAKKQRIRKEQGERYPEWVLDRLGIEVMFANRIAMGRGLNLPRFRWVPYDDALMYPLENSLMAENPDRKFFFSREDKLLRRYLSDLKLSTLPTTLDEYLKQVVTPTLERQKAGGAVAAKFETAYLRSLDFAPAAETEARAIYLEYFRGGRPESAPYKVLQDFLFHYIASEAGRLGMAVHLHTGAGCGGYFKLSGANPVLMDSVINDASLRKTTFVLVHGGPPYTHVTAFLLSKPNVYADFSEQTWLYSVRALARNIRDWLEWYPEKVLFGTDLYPDNTRPEIGWEEIGWQTTDVSRRALALALTGMMHDGGITRERALELARMALHDNAAKLYEIK